MKCSLNAKLSFLIKKLPLISLHPVLPVNFLVARLKLSCGILPAALSDARTGCNTHTPEIVVSAGTFEKLFPAVKWLGLVSSLTKEQRISEAAVIKKRKY